MSMTYVAIQNAVLENAFAETSRADAKTWIQLRHALVWDLEEWTFRQGTSAVTFTNGSQVVASVPSDFRHAILLYDAQGAPLRPMRDFREFYDRYNPNLLNPSSTPEAFTVQAGQILIGPSGDGTSGYLVYEKSKPALTNDSDLTGLPDGYDVALVHGGKAEGFKLANIPLWQGFDDDFNAIVSGMRRNYLTGIRGQLGQLGDGRPGVRQWA